MKVRLLHPELEPVIRPLPNPLAILIHTVDVSEGPMKTKEFW